MVPVGDDGGRRGTMWDDGGQWGTTVDDGGRRGTTGDDEDDMGSSGRTPRQFDYFALRGGDILSIGSRLYKV